MNSPILMLVGLYDLPSWVTDEEPPEDEPREPVRVVVVRHFRTDEGGGCARVLRLAKAQFKRNFPHLDPKKVSWDVYKVNVAKGGRGPDTGGLPDWLGPADNI